MAGTAFDACACDAGKSEQEKRLELIGGGVIEMWSLDTPDAARGRKYRAVAVDEAAMIAKLQNAWQNAIRPTLTDYRGEAWFLSTLKSMNYSRCFSIAAKIPSAVIGRVGKCPQELIRTLILLRLKRPSWT